ncbi:helix-turn-helix domain-containing protein [Capnocytophaga felis]|uniref:Helix-turn-helix domain-containing protein n=1 Tax=Capnocytophaga felis TaxID=2267611 RepID=A0A5M4BCD7_9FLAO|nr:helix-turn-helix domain-containing protein [Capnocytophaga felis]MDO4764288.1 helix-turn-helix domain-containing protein [Flavobacteriaceae bacterium]GET47150.1 hypothetical protein RCZ01_24520 [Capnocytophaga felis]GET49616.1 hypothetical protein RCZ02_24470 [Capnocytophaga felis]
MSSNIRVERICVHCKEQFIAKTFYTKYCSHKCSQKAYKQRIKQEKLEKVKEEQSVEKKVLKFNNISESADIESLNKKTYLSISEVCALMNLSDSTVRKLIKEERIKMIRLGKKHIIVKSEIENLMK